MNSLKQSLLAAQSKVVAKSKNLREVYTANQHGEEEQHGLIQSVVVARAKKDFMKSLYAFLRVCEDLRDIQSVVAKATIGYSKKAVELEKSRAQALSKTVAKLASLNEEMLLSSAGGGVFASILPETVLDSLKQ